MPLRRGIDDSAESADSNEDDVQGHGIRSGRLMEDADTEDVEGHARAARLTEDADTEDVEGHAYKSGRLTEDSGSS